MSERILLASAAAVVAAIMMATLALTILVGGTAAGACPIPADAAPWAAAGRSPAPSPPVAGGFDEEQTTNAAAIMNTGAVLGIPARGWVIAVAVAIQESSLRALSYGDVAGPDSRGLFQQRAAWGSLGQRMDPVSSARLFYTGGRGGQPGLLDVPGWESIPLTRAGQSVQRSAHPDAYATHEGIAITLVRTLAGPTVGPLSSVPARGPDSEDRDLADSAISSGRGTPSAAGACPDAATPSGEGPARAWVAPVEAPISSRFRTAARPGHNGVDLAAAKGTPVRAASDGTVTRIRCDITPASYGCDRDGNNSAGGCGWYLDIRHSDTLTTRYCHLQERPALNVGDRVRTGQLIASVGASGHVTGAHLHLEVHRISGTRGRQGPVDPVVFFRDHAVRLGSK